MVSGQPPQGANSNHAPTCYLPRRPPMNHREIVSFLWGVADLIRDTFKRGKYQDVILPLTVLRRLDSGFQRPSRTMFTPEASH